MDEQPRHWGEAPLVRPDRGEHNGTTRRKIAVVRLENAGEDRSEPRQRVAAALVQVVLQAERRLGHGIDRAQLAKRVNVAPASLYAYLNGTTLPRGPVFERLLDELRVTGAERGWLTTLRDKAEVAGRVRSAAQKPRGKLPVARQLPIDGARFIGRSDELVRMMAMASGEGTDAARVCVIEGPAGVGKTMLATRVGHLVKDLFPDGQLHADLHGFDRQPPTDPAEVLLGFLFALGTPADAAPPTLAGRAALFRSLLAGQRMLVVLDNAGSSEQVRQLIPSEPRCLMVITSRNRMDSLVAREGAARISLAVLAPPAAADMLAATIGTARVAAEPEAVRDLIDLCSGLPLALSVVASHAADRPTEPLAALVEELHDEGDRLDSLSWPDDDLDLRTIFQWSYDGLTPAAAWLFQMLGLHPTPEIGQAACTALGAPDEPLRPALRELLSANLLTEHSRGRFRMHDLLHAYARELFLRRVPSPQQKGMRRRMLDYYLAAAAAANTSIQPCDAEHREHAGPAPGDYAASMAWFTAECEVLLAMVDHAAEHGFESHAWRLAWACMVYLRRSVRSASRIAVQRVAVAAADRAGDRAARATSSRMLADALGRSRLGAETLTLLAQALAEFEELGDESGALRAHLSFARALDADQKHARAYEHAEAALSLATAIGENMAVADAYASSARQLVNLGRHEAALRRCERAITLYAAAGHAEGEASVLKIVGDAELRHGDPMAAIAAYERSLALDRTLGDRYWAAHALHRLGVAHRRLGCAETADRLNAEAIAELESLHHPDAEALRHTR
ncbi:NB-ARC domain-containing protein [Kutzneria sp. 744]|uniref:ATP-binding protein n=1 Tax=Kutzneria sp. (strain 744) TaxID=345341 RepID=UPI00350F1230